MSDDEPLLELLSYLKDRNYRFTAVTPATHARVVARESPQQDLRTIFGWNRPFSESDIDPTILRCLAEADLTDRQGEKLRSRVRISSLDGDLFLHSPFPTVESDAVFFGPDTYRFVRFLRDAIPRVPNDLRSIVDLGTGSGAGAVAAAHLHPGARIVGIDINPTAIRLARINSRAAGVEVEALVSSTIPPEADLVIANPPYIMDRARRAYRDGGELYGGQVAVDWVSQALWQLAPGGTMLLYTGASVVAGQMPLVDALRRTCGQSSASILIEETDPDVFGEELDQSAYAEVERIAVICATIRKR